MSAIQIDSLAFVATALGLPVVDPPADPQLVAIEDDLVSVAATYCETKDCAEELVGEWMAVARRHLSGRH